MLDMSTAIKNTISISLFNRGLAGKIFDDVKTTGAKVVMKNNTAECVLLSPDEYMNLMDEINDARLIAIANERLATYDESQTIAGEKVFADLGITEKDLEAFDEVEFE